MLSLSGRDPATGQGMVVSVEDGVIHAITESDYRGTCWISAGLVDLQVNGFAGYDLNDAQLTTQRIKRLAEKLLPLGVTTFLPTVITADKLQIAHSLRTIAEARQEYSIVAKMIPAVHLEGPYISPNDGPRGAHPLTHVRAPDKKEFTFWQECCQSLIGLVTLSPHWPESNEFITWLCDQGITVSIGHTDAKHEQITSAVDAGASMSTHLGNGASALLPRHPNHIWTQLAEDRLIATLIADGHHLPDETLKVMLRAKGLDKVVLVSDVVAVGGLSPGVYEQPIGGNVVLTKDKRLEIEGTPYLAGAARPLSDCVANTLMATDLALSQVLTLATCNAARLIARSGKLAVGERADLITFNWQPGCDTLAVQSVVLCGERVV